MVNHWYIFFQHWNVESTRVTEKMLSVSNANNKTWTIFLLCLVMRHTLTQAFDHGVLLKFKVKRRKNTTLISLFVFSLYSINQNISIQMLFIDCIHIEWNIWLYSYLYFSSSFFSSFLFFTVIDAQDVYFVVSFELISYCMDLSRI